MKKWLLTLWPEYAFQKNGASGLSLTLLFDSLSWKRASSKALQRLDRSGITVKSSFDVKPGSYLVRLVVRDKEGELMAARNGAVVIPY